MDASYVLPLRWKDDRELAELGHYLRALTASVEVIVVDGSPDDLFAKHAAEWGSEVTHIRPDERFRFLNGKVDGVTTGLYAASNEAVVIADDDVRYRTEELARVIALLAQHDLVRPQNYFDPAPWHACWDSARSLLNRAVGADFPGTLGLRRSTFMRAGGYDGNVLFENLELIRTLRAAGGTEIAPLDLYVRRLPPETGHFLSQRIRQAYDDLARPRAMTLWLSLVPALAVAARRRALGPVAAAISASVALAETGRRRAGGARYFPLRASLCAPLWLLERGICSWLAVWQRASKGGAVYGDRIIPRAATPARELERRS